MRFRDKNVVVMGGNGGIGLAAARAFQARGRARGHYRP